MTTETFTVDDKGRASIVKDPDAVLDYTFDWSSYLTPIVDTISSASVEADNGLNVDSVSHTTTKVTVWASAGNVGEKCTLTCRVVTAGGRTDDRSIYLKIAER